MDYLYNQKVLSLEMFMEIVALKTKEVKTRKLLFVLTLCGEYGFTQFCESLKRQCMFDVHERLVPAD